MSALRRCKVSDHWTHDPKSIEPLCGICKRWILDGGEAGPWPFHGHRFVRLGSRAPLALVVHSFGSLDLIATGISLVEDVIARYRLDHLADAVDRRLEEIAA